MAVFVDEFSAVKPGAGRDEEIATGKSLPRLTREARKLIGEMPDVFSDGKVDDRRLKNLEEGNFRLAASAIPKLQTHH